MLPSKFSFSHYDKPRLLRFENPLLEFLDAFSADAIHSDSERVTIQRGPINERRADNAKAYSGGVKDARWSGSQLSHQ